MPVECRAPSASWEDTQALRDREIREVFDEAPYSPALASMVGNLPKRATPRPPASPSVRPLDRLVALQRADGSWKLDDELAEALGWRDVKQLRTALGRALSDEGGTRAAATALALVWLELECQDSSDEWRILADKGRERLELTSEGPDAWLALAREALTKRRRR
jgi:hypothetical protein